jgi:hypothetical protein
MVRAIITHALKFGAGKIEAKIRVFSVKNRGLSGKFRDFR